MKINKFRVWDIVEQRMYYDVTQLGLDGAVYMQYTGVLDDNDKMIYEGDIIQYTQEVKFSPEYGENGVIERYDCINSYTQLGVVKFNKGIFEYRTETTLEGKHDYLQIPVSWLDNCVVVGNVFKNRDLVKKESIQKLFLS